MRWDDERYVRFYTRDTPEFLALTWAARGLFGLLMRKVDRAGILAVGKLGLKGVAIAVGGPWGEIEGPLRELLDDGCVLFDEPHALVVIPNYMDAQSAVQSDAARKRASRERAQASACAPRSSYGTSQSVTPSPEAMSRGVTDGHVLSRPVTSSHPMLSLAVPSLPDQDPPLPPARTAEFGPEGSAEVAMPSEPTARRRARRNGMRAMPEDWKPSADVVASGTSRGFGAERIVLEAERFADHHRAKGNLFVDWDAAFRKWLKNEQIWASERANGADRRRPTPSASAGLQPVEPHERAYGAVAKEITNP